ncbi:MAG: hypothetical protein M3Q69_14520 [Acidobacteriota bacterium]|nr:hypothetical protein [Acidobacteriota bacterium]
MNEGSSQTKRALLRAALVAQTAGEDVIRAHRVAAALLRTASCVEFCARAQIDCAAACRRADDPGAAPFDTVDRALEREAVESLRMRPFEPRLKDVFDGVLEGHGEIAVPPLQLLSQILRGDSELAARLSEYGVTAEAISVELRKELE